MFNLIYPSLKNDGRIKQYDVYHIPLFGFVDYFFYISFTVAQQHDKPMMRQISTFHLSYPYPQQADRDNHMKKMPH
ncbi:hypothetical protein BJJ98_04665 [Dickeya solani]|nr:hypothetical protein A4U42_16340 [Dickeya solani IPO 2222]AUH07821.1 hypothetical protein BJD21_04700 [Dickeya solani D s0432-1]AUH11844.1 hypothetical protein BJJ98_04665 [Dickeya solani]